MTPEKIFTLVDGRTENQRMLDEFYKECRKLGWKLNVVSAVDSELVAEMKMDQFFSHFVMWRGLVQNTYGEACAMRYFLQHSDRVTINTGGFDMTVSIDKFFQNTLCLADPLLKDHALPTYLAFSKDYVRELVKKRKLQYPLLLKPRFGSKGEGMILIKNLKDLEDSRINFFNMVAQQYVEAENDWRVFVLDGQVIGMMAKRGREGRPGDFLAKSAGVEHWAEKDPAVREELGRLALRITELLGLEFSGVDLIRDKDTGRFYLLEANVSAGWQNGFFEATGVNIPRVIMEWFEGRYRELSY